VAKAKGICFLVRSSKTEEGRRVGVDVCHLIIKTGNSPVYIYSLEATAATLLQIFLI